MAMERERECPVCGETTSFGRAASTNLNAGLKVKWRCWECDYTTVEIENLVEPASA